MEAAEYAKAEKELAETINKLLEEVVDEYINRIYPFVDEEYFLESRGSVDEFAEVLLKSMLMTSYRIWCAMGKPNYITYPAYQEKRAKAYGDRILPTNTTYVRPISELFDLILREEE